MSSELTAGSLRHAIAALRPVVARSAPALDQLDMVLGDGDMGGTLDLIFKALEAEAALPDDLGTAFQKLALDLAHVRVKSQRRRHGRIA